MENQKTSMSNQFLLKRSLQFLGSVSLLSLFLCFSAGFSLCPPHSFNRFFNTCLFSFLSQTLERKYMFLICNGILAFLAKSCCSSTSASQEEGGNSQNFSITYDDDMDVRKPEIIIPIEEEQLLIPANIENSFDEEVTSVVEEEEQQQEDELPPTEALADEEEEDEEEKESLLYIAEDEQKGEEEAEEAVAAAMSNEELANTEELNRRFEEFIRKMKEEIRIESQRHLIAAV